VSHHDLAIYILKKYYLKAKEESWEIQKKATEIDGLLSEYYFII
jgi:hypothetical protein